MESVDPEWGLKTITPAEIKSKLPDQLSHPGTPHSYLLVYPYMASVLSGWRENPWTIFLFLEDTYILLE